MAQVQVQRFRALLHRFAKADPARFLPEITEDHLADTVVHIDLSRPMDEIRAELSKHPVRTRVMLTGPMVVARDIAHAKIAERLDAGLGLPDYMRDYCVYYAGPAKTPAGMASGSFGPTTAGRMDSYVERFQAAGGTWPKRPPTLSRNGFGRRLMRAHNRAEPK